MKTPNIATKPAHTPTPFLKVGWTGESYEPETHPSPPFTTSFYDPVTLQRWGRVYAPTKEEAKIRAALIVRAVNSHADLVAALERANERFAEISAASERAGWKPNALRNYAKAGCAECCAALAKAKGQP